MSLKVFIFLSLIAVGQSLDWDATDIFLQKMRLLEYRMERIKSYMPLVKEVLNVSDNGLHTYFS